MTVGELTAKFRDLEIVGADENDDGSVTYHLESQTNSQIIGIQVTIVLNNDEDGSY